MQVLHNPLENCQFYVLGGRNQAVVWIFELLQKQFTVYISPATTGNTWWKRKYRIAVPDEELIMIR